MPERFEKFIKIANFFYLCVGIEPYKNSNQTSKNSIILALVFYITSINLNFYFIFELVFIYVAFSTGTNFTEAIQTASYSGFIITSDCKMLSVWYKKKVLTNLIKNLKEIYPISRKQQTDYNLKNYLRDVTFVMYLFVFMYMVLIWFFNLFAILQYTIAMVMDRPIEQFLPYHVWLPWDWKNTPWYYFLNATEILAGYTAASGFIASDLLLCALVTQICMHLDYIHRKIEEFTPNGGKDDLIYLNRMIAYHQKILYLTDDINAAFGVSLLFNFSTSSVIICFVGVQVTTGVFNLVSLKFTVFLISSLFQVFLICYYGQKITLSSENIAIGLYSQKWYKNATTSYKRTLILMMNRAQKPVQLKATIALPISLRTFTEASSIFSNIFQFMSILIYLLI
ncbi:odorant receptor 85b-like [Episyrphus balteatus]|uniref:odorant receptor 85b-like n=1 Tax=Episyrphus balteatus TaxID=286459 RepID=UPI002485FE01|nr:odorant receptor 85b-like [Episyrphus balteatus]